MRTVDAQMGNKAKLLYLFASFSNFLKVYPSHSTFGNGFDNVK